VKQQAVINHLRLRLPVLAICAQFHVPSSASPAERYRFAVRGPRRWC
jgi:hypothetical protein